MQKNVLEEELVLKIDKFKSKMKEAQNISKETGKKIAENTKFNVWENGVMTLSNGVQLVKKSEKELNNEIDKTSEITQTAGNEISKAFNKGLKSVKRLTLGFLGARSAFGLFRKYMSEYSSQNEEFAQKMQLTTNIITTALAPAFEFFANVIQYVVIGLARIVELLTGVNILGKTIDTSFKGASKSAKELNENLSGLDEISNIDQSASGLSTGIGSQLKALDDFQKKIAEVDGWFKKWKITDKLQTIRKFLQDIWNSGTMQLIKDVLKNIIDWSIKHPNAVATILGGMGLVNLIGKIMGSAGGTGLLGLVGNIKYLAGLGTIALTIALVYEGKKKLKEWYDNEVNEIENNTDKISKKIENSNESINKSIEENDKETAQKIFDNKIKNYDELMKQMNKLNNIEWALNMPWTKSGDFILGKSGKESMLNSIKEVKDATKEWIDQFHQLHEAGMLTEDQNDKYKRLIVTTLGYKETLGLTKDEMDLLIDDYLKMENTPKTIQNMSSLMKELGYSEDEARAKLKPYFEDLRNNYGSVAGQVNSVKQKIIDTFNKTYDFKMKFDADKTSLNSVIKNITGKINSVFGAIGLKLPSYDVGTAYVPNDQIAMIHEGERIIPKQYNNPDYLGQLGNSETNMLLLELNRSILELANKPSVFNVNGKELARATYGDFENEDARRGKNMAVRRV